MGQVLMLISIIFVLHTQFAQSALELPQWPGKTKTLRINKNKSKTILQDSQHIDYSSSRVIRLSWRPRLFLYKNFLTVEECDHLIDLARNDLKRSTVGTDDSDKSVVSDVRTSSGMFLRRYEDETVARIEDRIAAWTFLPGENGEAIQVLRYDHGQKYEPHFDFFLDKINLAFGGNRLATVLMYLSDVAKGGETVFPYSEAKHTQFKDESWSKCAKRGYAVKPSKGDALLFFNLHSNGTTDAFSLHGSCPVIDGEKWSATKWIHVRHYDW